uniref:CCHC-type domain-containing protein n=1 Tax=Tanacetum cinerariifolium TaxID=118510 RepID=A0A6L2KMR0_TANCI|nr:hypothetical protein [Tanacetum cinerariifolium]
MDSIILIGQKNTLVEYMILSNADNRPPMLDKDLYDSWKSRMELYMQNRENGRMILESVKHSPLIWPTIEENGVTKTKKYVELSAIEKSKLIVISRQLISFFKLHTYLEQHELHANEARIMRERSQDPLALVANHQMTPSHFNTYQSSYNNTQFQQQQQFSPSQQNSYVAGTLGTRANTLGTGGNYSSQQRVVKCFNYQGEGHMARQCPKPKRKIDATWYHKKVLLVEAQGNGKVLNEEEVEFLTDFEERQNADLSTREKLIIDDIIREKNAQFTDFEKEINNLKQTLSEQSKEKELLTKIYNVLKNESKEKEAKNIDIEIALEKKVKELDNIVCKMGQSTQTVHMLRNHKFSMITTWKQALGFQNPFYLKKAQQIRTMLYDGKLKRKEIADDAATIALEMYKLDPVILAPKVKNNREAHEYYLKHPIEQAAIPMEVVEQAKS